MDALLSLLREYWIVPAGLAVLVGPAVFSYIKQLMGKIKWPQKTVTPLLKVDQNEKDIRMMDITSILWLVDRAVDADNTELLGELRSVNTKFFDVHCAMRKSVTSSKQ